MQKAELQHGQAQHQPAAKQAKAASVESPQGEHIAQLETMMDSSPQAEKLGGLAAMMNASPLMAAQRKLFDSIHNSPHQVAQKKAFDAIHSSPHQVAQKKKFDNLFGTVQRATEEEPLQGKFEGVQRVTEEEPIQHKLASDTPTQLAPAEKRPNNTGLPDNLKSGIENLSGMSMDNVKVHYNSSQPAQLNALAYAQGTDIHVAPGQEQHLPHEAWHVVQQAQGRVQPTMQMKEGVPVNDDKGLEHEADVMGGRADAAGQGLIQRIERMGGDEQAHNGSREAGRLKSRSTDFSGGIEIGTADTPLQLVKFDRFQGFSRLFNWFQNPQEDELLEQETRLKEFLEEMKPYEHTSAGREIPGLRARFDRIESSTISSRDYQATLRTLKAIFTQLDRISTSIAKTGLDYERTHVNESDGWIEGGYEGPKASHLVYLIQETYSLLPGVLCTDKNKKVIKDAILGELRMYPFRNSDVTPGNLEFAKKRVALLRKNFKKMIDRITGDWEHISNALGLVGGLRYVHLTGSDFHNDGQSVTIIESTGGQKAVYKPRSLNPDTHLEGHVNSVHAKLDMELGTARFSEKTDDKGEHYGYMEFLRKATQLSDEQAKNYYRKMGRMVVSSKLLGVTDLHQENILTGPNGEPVIIDAETSFLPDIMMSEAWSATLIQDTLTTFSKEAELTPNHFYTDTELQQWQQDHPNTTPNLGFITDVRTASYREGGVYREDFLGGIREVITYVSERKQQVIQYLQERVRGISHVRIVPVATSDFTGMLSAYYRDSRHNVESIADMVETICNSLTQHRYIVADGGKQAIKIGLEADMKNTDVPVFHYEPANDNVYFHGQVIATHNPGIQQAIVTNVNRIAQSTVENVTANIG